MKKLRHPHIVRLFEVIDDQMTEKSTWVRSLSFYMYKCVCSMFLRRSQSNGQSSGMKISVIIILSFSLSDVNALKEKSKQWHVFKKV